MEEQQRERTHQIDHESNLEWEAKWLLGLFDSTPRRRSWAKRIRKRTNQSTIVDWDKKIIIIKWVCVYGKLDMQRDEVGKETDYIYTYI